MQLEIMRRIKFALDTVSTNTVVSANSFTATTTSLSFTSQAQKLTPWDA